MSAVLALTLIATLQLTPQASDSVYSSRAVRALVAEAAARSRGVGGDVSWLTSSVESEIGLLIVEPDGEQVLTSVEQIAGRATWSSDGSLLQSVMAYRNHFVGPALSTLTYMRGPWIMGPLVGDRVPLALAADSSRRSDEADEGGARPTPDGEVTDASGRRRQMPMLVSPLGSDREAFYRFSGGDTVLTLRLPTRSIPVVRVVVEPRAPSAEALLFRGEIHLDALEHGVVRMRGEVLGRERPRGLVSRVVRATLEGHFFLDVENALGDLGGWLPHRQWIELEVGSPLSEESAILRIVSDFSTTTPDSAPPKEVMPGSGARRALLIVSTDSSSVPGGWRSELGAATAERESRDLSDLRARWVREGVRFGTRGVGQAVRYDRVEGLFTGGGFRVGSAPGVPGRFAAVHAGWAWSERTARGGAELGLAGTRWEVAAGVGRELASTNDFPRPFETRPSIFGAIGLDDMDYVDRYSAGLSASVRYRSVGSGRVSVRAVRDRAPDMHVERPPIGGAFRPLRAVSEGDYAQVSVGLGLLGGRGGEYLAPGWSAAISWELARGDLEWQRVEASVRGRRRLGRWSGAGAVFGGVVASESPPPQALLEIGGWAGRLPGFAYKAFTGDRAAVGMVETTYALPLFEGPIRIGPLFLPSVSPSPLAQLTAGWTGASEEAATVLDANGWTTSGGVQATAFLGLRLFGGSLRLGAARPLGAGGRWRFELGLGDAGG